MSRRSCATRWKTNSARRSDAVQPNFDFEQHENLDRVRGKIGRAVLSFCSGRVGRQFHADELRKYVETNAGRYVAPASADRILRDLRQRGWIDYEITSRAGSLYFVKMVKGERCAS